MDLDSLIMMEMNMLGKVEEKIQEKCRRDATKIEGKAGDICLMHTWSLHGGLLIYQKILEECLISDLTAADNWPLMPPMVPSIYSGKIILGKLHVKYVFVKLNLNYQNIIKQILFLVHKVKKVNKRKLL